MAIAWTILTYLILYLHLCPFWNLKTLIPINFNCMEKSNKNIIQDRFGTIWGWVNDDKVFMFVWTIPLKLCDVRSWITFLLSKNTSLPKPCHSLSLSLFLFFFFFTLWVFCWVKGFSSVCQCRIYFSVPWDRFTSL